MDWLLIVYNNSQCPISSNIRVNNIFLDINKAIPCGLIINELVSNALKYAFPTERDEQAEICITLEAHADRYILVIGDNGVGLPLDFNGEQTSALGLQLVNILAQQLRGTIEIDRSEGTTFRLEFPK